MDEEVAPPVGPSADDPWVRWLRTTAYLCMALSGLFLIISPYLSDVYPVTAEVMAWFLLVGGTTATVGGALNRWWGEYVGTPLLMSSFAVFALITFVSSFPVYPLLAIGNVFLLSAVVFGLMARWRHARTVYLLAMHLAEKVDEIESGDES